MQLCNTSVFASEEYKLALFFHDVSCSAGFREERFGIVKVYKHVFTHRCKCKMCYMLLNIMMITVPNSVS
jgi:hypothetical protein